MCVRVCLLAAALAGTPCPAALPELQQQPWFGHFLAYANPKFTFGFNSLAVAKLTPLARSGKPLGYFLVVPVAFTVEETRPDGRTFTRKLLPDTLTTTDPPTTKPGRVSFRGKVTGGASFEGHVEVEHGVVAVGGRLLDKGTQSNKPLRLGIRVTFPNAYRNQPKRDKRAAKAFESLLKDDRLTIVRTDGKHVRLTGLDKVAADSKETNGPGIAELKVDVGAYQGRVFEFAATGPSRMELWNRLEQPLHEGFAINWYPDPATDPAGKARLKFAVK